MFGHSLFLFVVAATVGVLDCQSSGGPMHGKAVVCYVASWAVYRPGAGMYTLEDLEPSLCTHLVYAFAGLNDTTSSIRSLDPWQDLPDEYGKAGYNRIVGLKQRYPHLKVSIAIGGWNEGSRNYSRMAENQETREKFVKSVVQFLTQHKFDGLDLDWEYPTKREGGPQDKANFVELVKELKEAFEPHGYLLTAALGTGKETMDKAYDLPKLNRYLDFIHMMCYDYHGKWDGVVGSNAPLKGNDDDTLTIEYTIKYMMSHGVSASKMVLGLPMYGRTFLLHDPNVRDIEFGRSLIKDDSFAGPFTREAGFMGYNEICTEVNNKTSPWTQLWHEPSSTPYLRDGGRVVTYDNERSIAMKVKLAMDYGLRGLMVWSIDTDDFKGACGLKPKEAYKDFVDRYNQMVKNPLLNKILSELPDMNNNLGRHTAYVVSDGKLQLRLPETEYSNYALMRTINEAALLSLEEKRIIDEMNRAEKENEIFVDDKKEPNNSAGIIVNLYFVLCAFVLSAWI